MTTAAVPARGSRSTAGDQRVRIVARAVEVFAGSGYRATPVTDVAAAAGVSTAYVFRLFEGKLGLFVAAVDACYGRVADALAAAGEEGVGDKGGGSADPEARLAAMSDAYVALIADPTLIALQVHAQSACDVPEIRDAVRRGIGRVVEVVTAGTGADASAVQRFLAYGQLCHLVVQAGLADVDSAWARVVDHGLRHP